MVPGFLLQHHRDQPLFEFVIVGTRPHARAQVVFNDAEEAGPNLSVGREPNAIAMTAERLTDGGNNPDLAAAIGKGPALGSRRGVPITDGMELETIAEAGEQLASGDDQFFEPRASGIQRDKLDKTHGQRAFVAELSEVLDFMVVEAANDDGIDFDRVKSELLGQPDALQH